jgi:hypothetical protein
LEKSGEEIRSKKRRGESWGEVKNGNRWGKGVGIEM